MSIQTIISVSVEPVVERRSKDYATKTDRTLSKYVRDAIKFYNLFNLMHKWVEQGEPLEACELTYHGGYFPKEVEMELDRLEKEVLEKESKTETEVKG